MRVVLLNMYKLLVFSLSFHLHDNIIIRIYNKHKQGGLSNLHESTMLFCDVFHQNWIRNQWHMLCRVHPSLCLSGPPLWMDLTQLMTKVESATCGPGTTAALLLG